MPRRKAEEQLPTTNVLMLFLLLSSINTTNIDGRHQHLLKAAKRLN
jgi:hypothetical protein